ncbi:unnamed protein product [Cuscuta europaea]|uniref:Uncharacterized protein n=1 Tax=Cuscuta europaea TaxID=41803 RepID=A0A9P0Z2A1_CUSEU|nr:unnamed protein product [Cuscuta europaea]
MNCSNSSPLSSLSSNAMESGRGAVLEEIQGQLAGYAADSLSVGMIFYDIDVDIEFYKEFAAVVFPIMIAGITP